MVNQVPTPSPSADDEFTPKMHDPRESIHFVAATELVIYGALKPDTVELLVLLAPQPTVAFQPPPEGQSHGSLTVAFCGANSAMSKAVPIDAAADVASGHKLRVTQEDEITRDLAEAMKKRLQNLIHQRNAAVAKHMKKQDIKKKLRTGLH